MQKICRVIPVVFALAAVVPHSSVLAAAAEPVIASFSMPCTREGWSNPERWKEETVDGRSALRLTAGAGYPRLKVTGTIPATGMVLLRLSYHSSGKPIVAGIGAWGSPTSVGAARPKGWQVEEMVFPAAQARKVLANGTIGLFLTGGGADGPTLSGAELIVPSAEHVKTRYLAWVREGTDAALAAAQSKEFTEEKSGEADVPVDAKPADQALGAIPIARSYLEYIYPTSVPKTDERVTRGQVTLPPGEFEVFQFGLHALKDLDALSAAVEGAPPAGVQADVRWLECAPVRVGGSRSKKIKIVPNRLWTPDLYPTCSVKSGQSQGWYAIIRTDGKLAAGDYPLKIAVKQGNQKLLTFEVTVKVLPFTLPAPSAMEKLFLVTDGNAIEDEATLQDMAEHGLNATASFNDFRPDLVNGKPDFTSWDSYFARLKQHKLDSGFFWYLGNPTSGNAVKGSVGAAAFDAMVQEIQARVKDGRYPKNWFFSIDEAVCKGPAFAEHKALYQQCRKDAPALRVLGCALDRFSNTVKYEGNADMLACNGSFAEDSKWCREKNVLLNIYSSACFSFSSAADSRLRYGFFTYQYGSYAMNGWALRWYNGHPFNCLDAEITDWASFFPNWTGGRPISSPCWEGIRQGINDQRYLAVLEGLVKAGKSDGKLLEEIRTDGVGKVTAQRETVVGDTAFGVSMKSAPDLEIARTRVIQEILRALKGK
jgi:hypothetical protein